MTPEDQPRTSVVGSNMAIHLARKAGGWLNLGDKQEHELASYWARKIRNTRIYDLQSWFLDANGKPAHICRIPMPAIIEGEVVAARDTIRLQAMPFVARENGDDKEQAIFKSFYITGEAAPRAWVSRDRTFSRVRDRLITSLSASPSIRNAILNSVMRVACIHKINSSSHLQALLERTLSLLCAIATEPDPSRQANNAGDTQVDLLWSELTQDTGLYATIRIILQHPIHYLPPAETDGFQIIVPNGTLMKLTDAPIKRDREQSLIRALIPTSFPAMATP